MFGPFDKNEPSELDEAIDTAFMQLSLQTPGTEEYSQILNHVNMLVGMKTQTRQSPIDKNTVLIVAGNLVGILILVAYEQKHVVTSKALSFIQKLK